MDKYNSSDNHHEHETSPKREEEMDDSFPQNASFAEKNLEKESIFFPLNADHDIRKIDREKVENMVLTAIVQYNEPPPVIENIGRTGINEWIWKNKILTDIHSTFLKSFLNKKKRIDPTSYYQHYKLILELSQQIAKFRMVPINQVNDEDIFNEQTISFLLSNFIDTKRKEQLIKAIYKNGNFTNAQLINITTGYKSKNKLINRTLHPKIIEFLKQMDKEGKAESTKKRFVVFMNMFLPWISQNMKDFMAYDVHEIPVSKIKEMHLSEFRSYILKMEQQNVYSRITVAECLYAIKHFFQFLHKRYGFPNPARRLRSIKAPRYNYRDLPTEDQMKTFLQVINQYSDNPVLERVAFRFLYYLGLRSIEVARLSWNDINLETKTVRIHGKRNQYDLLPIVGELYNDLRLLKQPPDSSSYILGSSIDKNLTVLQNNYKLYSLIAGWEFPGGVHLFRHLFVTNLAQKGTLPQALQKLSRVEKMDTVSLYTHINQRNTWLNGEINKLTY
jgi:site-specific recombinase XerD/predicted DNA-binding antitoxin AbrB/MazE fold protein